MKNNRIYIVFVLLSLIFGTLFSIIIPLYQVPDELTHINYIYSYISDDNDYNFYEETNYFGDTSRIIGDSKEKVNVSNYINFDKKLDGLKIVHINYHIIRYFPQAIGIMISELFHFPIIIAITFSEILAIIFYTIICTIALKKMPIKKELFMMVMLLPMAIQQMGSFSYDMILNAFSFLFISYVLYYKFNKDKISLLNIFSLILILLLISFIKIPYILLGLLFFILSKERMFFYDSLVSIKENKKSLFYVFIGLFSLIVLFIFIKYLLNISYFKVIMAFILNPLNGIILIIRTIFAHLKFYVAGLIGYFGWFDTKLSIVFYIFVIFSLFFINGLSNCNANKFNEREKICLFIVFIFIALIIIISMFDWTLSYLGFDTLNYSVNDYANKFNIKEILGVQGRYFIPIIFILFLPFSYSFKFKNKKKLLVIYQICYYIIVFSYVIFVLLKRYWL